MPKVALTTDQKVQANIDRITRDVKHELSDRGISYTELAKKIGKTPQAVSQQFRKGHHMSLEVWVASQMALKGEI